jgi:hypothetical protein
MGARSIILPRMFHGSRTLAAKFEGHKLCIAFGGASRGEGSP